MSAKSKPAAFAPGHFYSPVVDPDDIGTRQDQLWPATKPLLGVDFNDAQQLHLLTDVFPLLGKDFDYSETADNDPTTFHLSNGQFGYFDAKTLFVLLRHWRPTQIIEVGSGFSSLLMADVKNRFLPNTSIRCIEPYPRDFLRQGVPGINELIEQRVEKVPANTFTELKSGDILFIDSSHVAKTGSDVNHLYFNVLPKLASGVYIHIHDIFLPDEYPKNWVLNENRSWNEQYLLHALLMHSNAFEVQFGCQYVARHFPVHSREAYAQDMPAYSGGSFWLVKK